MIKYLKILLLIFPVVAFAAIPGTPPYNAISSTNYLTRANALTANGLIVFDSTGVAYFSNDGGNTWRSLGRTPYKDVTKILDASDLNLIWSTISNVGLYIIYNNGSSYSYYKNTVAMPNITYVPVVLPGVGPSGSFEYAGLDFLSSPGVVDLAIVSSGNFNNGYLGFVNPHTPWEEDSAWTHPLTLAFLGNSHSSIQIASVFTYFKDAQGQTYRTLSPCSASNYSLTKAAHNTFYAICGKGVGAMLYRYNMTSHSWSDRINFNSSDSGSKIFSYAVASDTSGYILPDTTVFIESTDDKGIKYILECDDTAPLSSCHSNSIAASNIQHGYYFDGAIVHDNNNNNDAVFVGQSNQIFKVGLTAIGTLNGITSFN